MIVDSSRKAPGPKSSQDRSARRILGVQTAQMRLAGGPSPHQGAEGANSVESPVPGAVEGVGSMSLDPGPAKAGNLPSGSDISVPSPLPRAALQGLRCAFPEDVADAGTKQAIAHVLDACRAALAQCFPDETSTEVVDVILDSIDRALKSYMAG